MSVVTYKQDMTMCWNSGSQQYPKISNFAIYSQIVNLITLIHFLLFEKFSQSQDSVNCCQLNKLDDVVRSKHWLSVSWAEAWVSRLLRFGWGHREKRRTSICSAPPPLHRSSFALHHYCTGDGLWPSTGYVKVKAEGKAWLSCLLGFGWMRSQGEPPFT